MIRRSIGTLLLALSLWIGTLAWSGFIALRTVFDEDRSRDIADSLYENDAVRAQLEANIAGAVTAALPDGIDLSDADARAAAGAALDSPAVEALFVDAFVGAHRAFLGEGDPPSELEGGAFGSAARDAIVDRRPELDGVLPAAPDVTVPLPTERIPDAGPIKTFLETAVPVMAAAAAVGVLVALVTTSDRPAVIRRAGWWAIGLSSVVLIIAFAVPWLAEQVAPSQSAVIAALTGALARTTRGPALALAGAGLAALVGSAALARARTRRPDDVAPPAGRRGRPAMPSGPPPAVPSRPRGGRTSARVMPSGPSPRAASTAPAAPPSPTAAASSPPTSVGPPPAPAAAGGSPEDATRVDPAWTGLQLEPRFVEGHGWVLHPEEPVIPPHARWTAGVGYVLDDPPRDG